jgi:YidC/Oxa1 family membrane protein insertase
MERRTLLAILLIMAVLIGDQVLMSRLRKKPAPVLPAGRDSVFATPGGSPAATSGPAAGAASPAPGASPGSVPAGGTSAQTQSLTATQGTLQLTEAPSVQREIRNEHFQAVFSSEGGSIVGWTLPRYPDLMHGAEKAPVNLVPPGERAMNVSVTTSSFDYDFAHAPFRVDEVLSSESAVMFVAEDASGVRVTKSYRVAPDPRAMDVEIHIRVPAAYGAIQYRWGWDAPLPITEHHARENPKERQAVALVGDKVEVYDIEKLSKGGPKELTGTIRWAGSRNKYFVAVLLPDSATVSSVHFAGATGTQGLPVVTMNGAAPPGTEVIRRARLYAGPVHYETLVAQGAELDRLANLGWRWITGLSALLLWSLNALHKVIPNYGIAIILLSIATKLVFYPLTQSSLRAMKLMHHLQPQVKALQEKHQGDPQRMNKEMMALYKEHKVNPVSGCLPLLIQMPIFFALYNVLLNSIELRGAGFMGYIQDLSLPDVAFAIAGFPIHILPLVMTGSTYLMQSQTPVAPAQKPMMMLMPMMMLIFMYTFPSGVILYWTVTNLLSAAQQYIVNVAEDRRMAAERA